MSWLQWRVLQFIYPQEPWCIFSGSLMEKSHRIIEVCGCVKLTASLRWSASYVSYPHFHSHCRQFQQFLSFVTIVLSFIFGGRPSAFLFKLCLTLSIFSPQTEPGRHQLHLLGLSQWVLLDWFCLWVCLMAENDSWLVIYLIGLDCKTEVGVSSCLLTPTASPRDSGLPEERGISVRGGGWVLSQPG